MKWIFAFSLPLLACALPLAGVFGATPLTAGPTLQDHNGMCVHFLGGRGRDLDLIAEAGFRTIRTDFKWQFTEKTPGLYDFSAYDRFMDDLERRHMRALFILDYSNPLYAASVNVLEKGVSRTQVVAPVSDTAVTAYAAWAAAAVKHFAGKPVIWELWNEPDADTFWRPQANVQHYLRLTETACTAIRKDTPDAVILGPAVTNDNVPTSRRPTPAFLASVISSSLPACLSAISFHPYRFHKEPDSIRESISLTNLMQAPSLTLPLVTSEWGYTTGGKPHEVLSEEMQAIYLVRTLLVSADAGIPLTFWYDWKDDGPNPHDKEHRFGLLRQNQMPKPAYNAARYLAQVTKGYAPAGRVYGLPDGLDGVYLTHPQGGDIAVIWRRGERAVSQPVLAGNLPLARTLTDMYGTPIPTLDANGQPFVKVGPAPMFFLGVRRATPQ